MGVEVDDLKSLMSEHDESSSSTWSEFEFTWNREPNIYGRVTLDDIDLRLSQIGNELGFEVRSEQSNHEGELIEYLHSARLWQKGWFSIRGLHAHFVALRML